MQPINLVLICNYEICMLQIFKKVVFLQYISYTLYFSYLKEEIKTPQPFQFGVGAESRIHIMQCERPDFLDFCVFAKDETDFFPYSNLIQNIFGIFVFAKNLRSKCGSECETQILKMTSKIFKYFEYFRKIQKWVFFNLKTDVFWL